MDFNKRIFICSLLPALFALGDAQAQLYKWVGPDGKVTYSDQPPPANLKQVEKKKLPNVAESSNLPPELAPAVAKNPITLYTSTSCAPCDDGRNFLKNGGIPFTEKTVNSIADQEKLKQIGGDMQLPLMVIANVKFRGYSADEWRDALNQAGYPSTNKLPKDYRYAPAEPAAPPPPPAPAKETALPKTPASPPVKKPDNGFKF